jgi:hypothetical protein
MTNNIENELRNKIEELETIIWQLRDLIIENRKNLKQTRFDLWERTSENKLIAQQAKDTLDNEFGGLRLPAVNRD